MKNKVTKFLVAIIVLLLIIIIALAALFGINLYKTSTEKSKETNTIEKIETTTVDQEGVYITDVSSVVENAMPSIVAITSKTIVQSGSYGPFGSSDEQYYEGAGSGIIISQSDEKILILTNEHVVSDSTELTVQFIDGTSADAKVVGSYERKDIAVIYVNKKDLSDDTKQAIKIASLGSSEDLKVGQGIIAIGNALGYGQSVTTGVISALDREVETDNYTLSMIQIDAAINGGNSGGALLNASGEVIGINSAKYSSSGYSTSASIEGMGFAIPISDVMDTIEAILDGKEEEDPVKLGIGGYMTTSSSYGSSSLPEGFYVTEITSGGNADNSDLEIGNIITEIDGNAITSVNTISKVLANKSAGDTVKLKVKYVKNRSYAEKEITITLAS